MDRQAPTARLESATNSLHFWSLPWQDRSKLHISGMDSLIRRKWEAAFEDKVFLHGVESEPHRMHGHKGFVAMLCRNRASHKRKAQSFTSVLQEADPKSFNFTKVKPAEVLFQFKDEERNSETESSSSILASRVPTTKTTSVIINNSPFEYAHCLLVPDILECHIQSITLDAIKLAIKVLLNSSHPGFRLMYNSLCAGASVNHLHLHCYYTEYWLPCEVFQMSRIFTIDEGPMISDLFELDFNDTGVRGFGFVITPENYESRLPIMVHNIVKYFNTNNIAHNIVITRGIPPSAAYAPNEKELEGSWKNNERVEAYPFDISKNPNIPTVAQTSPYGNNENITTDLRRSPLIGRLYIFPRMPLHGEKCYRKFLVNVTELFGHLYFGDVAVFESMDEYDVIRALNSVSFSEQQFNKVKCDITRIMSEL